MKVMFDTCAAVALLDENRPDHESALACYKRLCEVKAQSFISSIAVSEYAVCHEPAALFELFEVVDFNARHAQESGKLKRKTLDKSKLERGKENSRTVIVNDTQIIAQADSEQMDFILTSDAKTFKKTADWLLDAGLISTKVLLLSESPLGAMGLGEQMELPLEQEAN